MKKNFIIIVIILFSMNILAINTEIRNLSLKISLFDTFEELSIWKYKNIVKESLYPDDMIKDFSKFYDSQSEDYKNKTFELFNIYNASKLINQCINLSDNASFEEIMDFIEKDREISLYTKNMIKTLYIPFYNDFFRNYFTRESVKYTALAVELNRKVLKEPDIIKFVEKNSGINFKSQKKLVLYLTLRLSMYHGIEKDDEIISTIQATDYNKFEIYQTPFHEISHKIFNFFIDEKEYKNACIKIKIDNNYYNLWKEKYSAIYEKWRDWCTENLVEGFTYFLYAKLTGEKCESPVKAHYYYDWAFYDYLMNINFSPNKDSLEEAAINFMISIVK